MEYLLNNKLLENLNSWNWNLFFKTVVNLGNQFNQASWRMMKGEVICTALEVCSNGQAIYVDEVGYDLVVDNFKIEVKTEKKIINQNLDTKYIQLKNTRGEIQKFKQSFDYLLIANTGPISNTKPIFFAALTDWNTVYQNHKPMGDQIQCKLFKKDLNLLTSKEGVEVSNCFFKQNDESLKNYMKNGIKEWIKSI